MLLLLLAGPLVVVAILMEPAILLVPLALFCALAIVGSIRTPAERRPRYNGSGHMHSAEDITSGRLEIHAHGPNCAGKRATVHDHRWAGAIQHLKMTGKWWPEGHPRY